MSGSTKKVTFSKDVKEPQVAEKCSCCGHRNIVPRIREMLICTECYKQVCCQCITSMDICIECDWELFGISTETNVNDYEEIND